MTGEELERTIQFLLESQAKNDAQIGQLGARADEPTREVAQLTNNATRLTDDLADIRALVREFAESTRLFAVQAHETIFNPYRTRRAARPRERGHRPDGAQAVSEVANARRVRPRALLRLALPGRRKAEPGVCPQRAALPGRFGSAGAGQFRLRF